MMFGCFAGVRANAPCPRASVTDVAAAELINLRRVSFGIETSHIADQERRRPQAGLQLLLNQRSGQWNVPG